MTEVIILGNIWKGRNQKDMLFGETFFFNAEQEKQLMQTKHSEYKS